MEPIYSVDGFQVFAVTENFWKQNAFFIVDTSRSSCIAIDPGYGVEAFLHNLKKQNIIVERVIATHTHFDHIAGVSEVQKIFNAPFLCHEEDLKILAQANIYTMVLKSGKVELPIPSAHLTPQIKIQFGGVQIEVIHVPGHTPGGCIFVFMGTIFSGDTLLRDFGKLHKLPGSDPDLLAASRERIFKKLPPETVVFPGHGRMTTLASLARSLESKQDCDPATSTPPFYE